MSKSHYLYSSDGRQYLQREYVEAKKSARVIAEQLTAEGVNTYHTLVQRALKHYGFLVRDKSAAQAEALKTGTAKHPTKGKRRPDEVRNQISTKLKIRDSK